MRTVATSHRPGCAGGASLGGQTKVGGGGVGPRDVEKSTRSAPLRGYALVEYAA